MDKTLSQTAVTLPDRWQSDSGESKAESCVASANAVLSAPSTLLSLVLSRRKTANVTRILVWYVQGLLIGAVGKTCVVVFKASPMTAGIRMC